MSNTRFRKPHSILYNYTVCVCVCERERERGISGVMIKSKVKDEAIPVTGCEECRAKS
jgi:hypothetical protein